MSLLSLLIKPYYRRKPAFIEVVVRIGTFWYTIRGSNCFAILQTIENRRFEASPGSVIVKLAGLGGCDMISDAGYPISSAFAFNSERGSFARKLITSPLAVTLSA